MAATVLSDEERRELEASIAEYLSKRKFACAEAFRVEAGLNGLEESDDKLERKWRSIVRLQRRVMELEDSSTTRQRVEWCPRSPHVSALRGHRAPITALAASGEILASGAADGSAKLWHLERRSLIATVSSHVDSVTAVCVRGDLLLTCSADTTAKIYVGLSGKPAPRATLRGHDDAVCAGVFLDDTRCATAGRDGGLRVWDIDGRALSATSCRAGEWLLSLASTENNEIAGAGSANDALVWRIVDGSLAAVPVRLSGHSHRLEAVAFNATSSSSERRYLATAGRDAVVKVWTLDDPEPALFADLKGHASWVKAVAWLPTGDRVLLRRGRRVDSSLGHRHAPMHRDHRAGPHRLSCPPSPSASPLPSSPLPAPTTSSSSGTSAKFSSLIIIALEGKVRNQAFSACGRR